MLAFKHDDVRREYDRWRKIIAAETGPTGVGMSLDDVLAVHFLIVDMFYKQREGLGGIGPKDIGLLSSAVNRQHASFGGKDKWTTIEDKIATLLYGVVIDHPFHDANKRTGFLAALYFFKKQVDSHEYQPNSLRIS